MKKTLLILGSTGFVGRNLKEALAEDYKLLTPTHKELDLLDQNKVNRYFKNHTVDTVINCVVVGGSRPEEHENDAFKSNLKMLLNIMNNAKYFNKYIHLGSGAEYDKSRPLVQVKESEFGSRIPQDDYGLFKYISSLLLLHFDKAINLRIFGLFGKYEDTRYRFISNAILSNLSKKPIKINQNVYFDYVYIEDFVKIIKYFIENSPKEKNYNIGTGKKIDLYTIAEKINSISSNKVEVTVEKKGLNNEYTCDNSQLMNEVSVCFEDFDTSMKMLYSWYKKNLNIK